jgi:hypothetical protein
MLEMQVVDETRPDQTESVDAEPHEAEAAEEAESHEAVVAGEAESHDAVSDGVESDQAEVAAEAATPATPGKPATIPGQLVDPTTPGAPGKPVKSRKSGARVFTRQGRRPHLSVTIGLSTLAGLDNLPGTLAGFGAIPAALARSIAASAGTITALLTNPDTGTITAAGALTYRPTQDLRDQIAALVDTCRFPSCRQPVWRCEYDHRDPFNHRHPEQGGKTDQENIDPYCKRHHIFKHHTQWKVRPDPDRTVLHFTSPTGHHYSKHGRQASPPQLWVDTVGADTAEHLDNIINPPTTLVDPEPRPASGIEEFLTNILIRHALTTRPIEYQHDETAWQTSTAGHANGGQGDDDENSDNDGSDDPPPF